MSGIAAEPEYPTLAEVEAWVNSIWELADSMEVRVEMLPEQGFTHRLGIYHAGSQYVRFSPSEMCDFYGYWQPAQSSPAPLLVHVPGYGAEMSTHPDLVAAGFNVLHVNPLGYATPSGPDESKKRNGIWPVLPDTITTLGQKGYREWLANCVQAVRWALEQPQVMSGRISFFGTSQGGGGSLLLGSAFRERGVRCVAADLPFLTDFRGAGGIGAYATFAEALSSMEDKPAGWRAAGLIDTLSHAPRLDLPVLLTAGGTDDICPPHTIDKLFAFLPRTKSYTYLYGCPHRYTPQFITLAAAWFRAFA